MQSSLLRVVFAFLHDPVGYRKSSPVVNLSILPFANAVIEGDGNESQHCVPPTTSNLHQDSRAFLQSPHLRHFEASDPS